MVRAAGRPAAGGLEAEHGGSARALSGRVPAQRLVPAAGPDRRIRPPLLGLSFHQQRRKRGHAQPDPAEGEPAVALVAQSAGTRRQARCRRRAAGRRVLYPLVARVLAVPDPDRVSLLADVLIGATSARNSRAEPPAVALRIAAEWQPAAARPCAFSPPVPHPPRPPKPGRSPPLKARRSI